MRLVECDELYAEFRRDIMGGLNWDRILREAKTVDAVQVVRCRDCEHKDRESGFCHGRGWPMQLVPDDGFFDKGKKR